MSINKTFKKNCSHYTESAGYPYCNIVEGSIEKIGCYGCRNFEELEDFDEMEIYYSIIEKL